MGRYINYSDIPDKCNLFDESELAAKITYCEKCEKQYIEDFTDCNCIKKKHDKKRFDLAIKNAIKQLEEK